ncbi:MAG TPA: hypothetical protein PLY91_09380 [Methanoregulaceae archaeon]|nr:hypothetical protein [Methanoregulaceae archaeon]
MRLVTRLRCWWLERYPFERITPLNTVAEWDEATPDTLAFHAWMKKPLRFVAKRIAVPRTWLDQLTGNAKVLHEIVTETYLRNERQEWRRAILKPVIEFGLCLYAFDNNYREVFDALLAAVVRNRDRFVVDANEINPTNWYQDGRGRIVIEQSPPFGIVSLSDTDVVTNAPVGGPVIMTVIDGQATYLKLDVDRATEPVRGIHVYPILARSVSVLDVSPPGRVSVEAAADA